MVFADADADADADLRRAVPGAAMGVFANSGQACCAGTRIFVERPIHDEFVDAVARYADRLTVGDSRDPPPASGPSCPRSSSSG